MHHTPHEQRHPLEREPLAHPQTVGFFLARVAAHPVHKVNFIRVELSQVHVATTPQNRLRQVQIQQHYWLVALEEGDEELISENWFASVFVTDHHEGLHREVLQNPVVVWELLDVVRRGLIGYLEVVVFGNDELDNEGRRIEINSDGNVGGSVEMLDAG